MEARASQGRPYSPAPAAGIGGPRALLAGLAFLIVSFAAAPLVRAQISTSYVDDSVLARESLSRVEDLVAAGNLQEAARVIQAVLDTETERVIESPSDPTLYVNVRAAVHRALIARPDLLARYRQSEEPVAQAMLREGRVEEVERARLLTRSGMEAALRLAFGHFESARFEAARLTLAQLQDHPDRVGGPLGKSAADLALRLSAYLPRREVREMATRWATDAGLEASSVDAAAWPPRWAESIGRDSARAGPAPMLDGLVEGPLQSAFLSGDSAAEYRAFLELPRDENLSVYLLPWTFPNVVGDDVLVNDGRAITAFDRFTLSARWRRDFSEVSLDEGSESPQDALRTLTASTRIEDATTVAAAEGVAVASTGLQAQQLREGDNRLHGIEIATGRELWALTTGDIAENLRLADFRGPVVLDQGTAIQSFRKESAARRLSSTYLAGVDLWSGKTRWVRLIGSAGSIGSFATRPGETPVTHEGMIYRADDAGLISAVESVTGRIHWIRILKSDLMSQNDATPPWASQAPIVDGPSLVVLDPTRRELHRLALADGAKLSARPTTNLPSPIQYILAAGEGTDRSLVVVTDNTLAVLPMASFETARASLVPPVVEPGFRGRVVVMGDTLAAPINAGLLLVKVSAPANPQLKPLEHVGNFVASGSNLLVTDTWRLHSFLSWTDADRLLSARMQADPQDPRPALALAELAYRAQKLDRLVPALDHALSAIASSPQALVSVQARPRLFSSVLEMVHSATHAQPKPGQASRPLRINDLALVDNLVTRLERVAETPTENVQWLVALGALRELQSNAAEACGAYQRILEDTQLAENPWRETSPPIKSREMAIERLRSVVALFGVSAYARFGVELDGEIAALRPGARAEDLEALAWRFPIAPRAPELLVRAAALHRSTGQHAAGAAALARAADTAWWLVSVGIPADQAMLGEVVGSHAQALADLGRPMSAAHVLLRAVKTRPGLSVTLGGAPINPTARAAELRTQALTASRPARIGSQPGRAIDVLLGWSLLPAVLDEEVGAPVSHEWAIMANPQQHRFGVMIDLGSGSLSPSWTRPYAEDPPTVLRAGPDSLYVLWHEDTSVERLDPATGETVWRSGPLERILPPTAPGGGIRMIDTPLDSQVRSIDIVAAIDDRSVVLCQRDGAAVAFDATSGQVAWSQRTPLTRVYDLALSEGSLVLSGAADPSDIADAGPPDRLEPRSPPKPLIVAMNASTGKPLYDPLTPESDVRWVRASRGVLVAALVDRIRCMELATGKPLYNDLAGEESAQAAEGWIFDQTLYILSRRRELWLAPLRNGAMELVDLKGMDRLPDRGHIVAGRIGANIAFSSTQGIFLLNADGRLCGTNTLSGRREFLPALAAKDVIVLVENSTDELTDGRSSIRIMLVTADSAKMLRSLAVVVQGEPASVNAAILDGKLVLSTDAVTQVITLPEEPQRNKP